MSVDCESTCRMNVIREQQISNTEVSHRRSKNDNVRGELVLSDLGLAWAAAAANHVHLYAMCSASSHDNRMILPSKEGRVDENFF